MTQQIDIAEDLGVVPPSLPDPESLEEFDASGPKPPPQLVEGILHQGCKMILGGTSKSNKSWCLLDLAISVASGQEWWGRRCLQAPVIYINFELHRWAVAERLQALRWARPECQGLGTALTLWNLRGRNADLTDLRPQLEEKLARHQFGLIILDPAYKLLGNRDENSNGDIGGLMNEFEALGQSTGAAVVLGHHFAKGDSTTKNAIDRMSGAGAWARDPDSLLMLTPHEEKDCFTVNAILRNLPQLDEFVVEWKFPLMRVASGLNPGALRRPQARHKVCSDREFVERFITDVPASRASIVAQAAQRGISRASADRYLKHLTEARSIHSAQGLYWREPEALAREAVAA